MNSPGCASCFLFPLAKKRFVSRRKVDVRGHPDIRNPFIARRYRKLGILGQPLWQASRTHFQLSVQRKFLSRAMLLSSSSGILLIFRGKSCITISINANCNSSSAARGRIDLHPLCSAATPCIISSTRLNSVIDFTVFPVSCSSPIVH